VRLRDLADATGLSVSTVSHALNGNGTIAEATAATVRQVAADLNYRPDQIAASLRRQKTSTVGVLTSFLNHPYYAELMAHVEAEAVARGLTILAGAAVDAKQTDYYLDVFLGQRCAGLIVFAGALIPGLAQGQIPTVVIDPDLWMSGLPISSIGVDSRAGVRVAVQHLLGLGHRRIALVSNRVPTRRAGYDQAIVDAGLAVDPSLVIELPQGEDEWVAAAGMARDLLERRRDVTAVMALSDAAAFGVIRAAYGLGRRVPGDLAVVGYDDISLASTFVPALTTIRQPIAELARGAVELLVELLDGGEFRTVMLPTDLVIRESCGAQTGGTEPA
jgi:DNA-binding LacI/PurR family transcriptional regulator